MFRPSRGHQVNTYTLMQDTNMYLFLFIYLTCKCVFTRWQWYYSKTQHTSHKITHHSQTKHSTQNYASSKGHYTKWIQCKHITCGKKIVHNNFCLGRPPLLSSGQSSLLQIQRSGFNSRRYQIFWEVVGLERGPLNLVMIIEELFQGNSGFGLENWN
jgi:hypothetical protein